jgi:hypothetical protein
MNDDVIVVEESPIDMVERFISETVKEMNEHPHMGEITSSRVRNEVNRKVKQHYEQMKKYLNDRAIFLERKEVVRYEYFLK